MQISVSRAHHNQVSVGMYGSPLSLPTTLTAATATAPITSATNAFTTM